LQPQVDLLHAIEERASADFADKLHGSLIAGDQSPRVTRVQHPQSFVATTCHVQQCHGLMRDPELWAAVPQADRTQSVSSRAFAMVSMAVCSVSQLLHVPQAGFPYCLFKLLTEPGEATAQALLAQPQCLLDAFSKSFLTRFSTPARTPKTRFFLTPRQTGEPTPPSWASR
jgi:hypothetical protein